MLTNIMVLCKKKNSYICIMLKNKNSLKIPKKKIKISTIPRQKVIGDRRSRSDRRSLFEAAPDRDLDLILDPFLAK